MKSHLGNCSRYEGSVLYSRVRLHEVIVIRNIISVTNATTRCFSSPARHERYQGFLLAKMARYIWMTTG